MEFEDIITKLKTNNIILTKNNMKEIQSFFESQQNTIKERLKKVKNVEMIGLPGWDYGEYYPIEFIEIVDEETGTCKFFEKGINKFHLKSVLSVCFCENGKWEGI